MTRCIECKIIETYYGYAITREVDKKIDLLTNEPYGRATVFYTVYEDVENGDMLESFKTLKEAKKYIDKLL